MILTNVPQTIVQPNGEVINCYASGNDYSNYLHDKNGHIIIQNSTNGYYSYATYDNNKLVSSNYIVTNEITTNTNLYNELISINDIKTSQAMVKNTENSDDTISLNVNSNAQINKADSLDNNSNDSITSIVKLTTYPVFAHHAANSLIIIIKNDNKASIYIDIFIKDVRGNTGGFHYNNIFTNSKDRKLIKLPKPYPIYEIIFDKIPNDVFLFTATRIQKHPIL